MAALLGLAIGDALGMPGQTLDRAAIRAAYGRITGFVDPLPDHPVSHGLSAGMVTDDTEQTLLLARRLIADRGGFDTDAWAADLLGWEGQEVQLQVLNVQGQVLLSQSIQAGSSPIALELSGNWSEGLYFVSMNSTDGTRVVQKVMITR